MGLYDKLIPIAIGLALSATSFFVGVAYGQAPYVYTTLFAPSGETTYTDALAHYQRWAALPKSVIGVFYGVAITGFIGFLTLVYKPHETLKLYDYVSLAVYFFGLCVFLTNIKTGITAAVHGNWGEVDMPTGVSVIGASIVIAVILLFGVLFLQAGRYYQIIENAHADIEYQKAVAKLEEEEKAAQEKQAALDEKKAKKDARNAKKYGYTTGSEVSDAKTEDGLKQRKQSDEA